jgi:integrase
VETAFLNLERFLSTKAGKSQSNRRGMTSTFRRLESLSGIILSDLTAEQIEEALVGFPPSSRDAALRHLRAAFNFGIPRWLSRNPIEDLEFSDQINSEVELIAPATVEKLLLDALANDLAILPHRIFTIFAGVRPDQEGEISKLLWSDVDLSATEHHVTVRAAVAKKRRKRWIDLSPNALAWLEAYRTAGGNMEGPVVPLSPSTLRRKLRRNARAAGIEHWPQQGARHSYCSYALRQYGDITKCLLMSGHESEKVFWDRYYKATTPAEAAAREDLYACGI